MIALSDADVAMALAEYKNQMAAEVAAKDAKLQSELE